jgi:hypothetical protein
MNPIVQSMMNASTTLNGGATNLSSNNPVVDLFFQIGAMRAWSEEAIIQAFERAFAHNQAQALKVLFWARDIRQGSGERRTFRVVCRHLAQNHTELMNGLMRLIPEYGRWDDLLCFINPEAEKAPCEEQALFLIADALYSGNALAAKWCPRERSSKRALARKIRKHMRLCPREYRKLLSSTTKVVESQMCAGEWDSINYGHVPSQAMSIYKNAFGRHSEERWAEYLKGLASGTEKVNAGAIYPHEIIGKYISQYEKRQIPAVSEAQWAAMPNWMENNPYRILPVVDTSGSMYGSYAESSSLKPIQVSVALGLYIAERNEGPFKDCFVTFSENPAMQYVYGDNLTDRVNSVSSADWGMNTDLYRTFDAILSHAQRVRAAHYDMPNVVLILSDMEFDVGVSVNKTAMEQARELWARAGYEFPKIVFWNLNARGSNVPVLFREDGTALVSGFSPAIMKSLLSGDNFTPEGIMLQTIEGERYSQVSL